MAGMTGFDLAGCAVALKSRGGPFWDRSRGCIPRYTLDAMKVIESVIVTWELCRQCRDQRKAEKVCSACGCSLSDKPNTVYGPEW